MIAKRKCEELPPWAKSGGQREPLRFYLELFTAHPRSAEDQRDSLHTFKDS